MKSRAKYLLKIYIFINVGYSPLFSSDSLSVVKVGLKFSKFELFSQCFTRVRLTLIMNSIIQ